MEPESPGQEVVEVNVHRLQVTVTYMDWGWRVEAEDTLDQDKAAQGACGWVKIQEVVHSWGKIRAGQCRV